ncbi:MAG: hypothetical protein LUE27_11040 [Clostridia bacterium]|nr:hypothetical protein [Clostridia bacterium]
MSRFDDFTDKEQDALLRLFADRETDYVQSGLLDELWWASKHRDWLDMGYSPEAVEKRIKEAKERRQRLKGASIWKLT